MSRTAAVSSRPSSDYAIHAVEKALDLLEAICDQGGEARVTELSHLLGMNKTNVFRLLATFEHLGFVERGNDPSRYRLGLTACEMGRKLISHMDIPRMARPAMEQLVRATGEAAYFLTARNSDVIMLDMIDSPHQVKVVPLICRRIPLTTPLGQLFLAFGSGETRERTLREAAKDESNGLGEGVARIRLHGYAIDNGSFDDGVTALGVPLFNYRGEPIAALALIGPTFRMGKERIDNELLPLVLDAGMAISASLGYSHGFQISQAV